MELHKDLILGNLPTTSNLVGFLSLYMKGAAPTSASELKAAIDIYDFLDIYNKSIGVAYYSTTSANSGQTSGATINQTAGKVALKNGPLDFAIPSGVLPAGTSKASIPDRIFACETSAPFTRLDSHALGMASIYAANMAPWLTFDSSAPPPHPGKSIGQPHLGVTTCQEFEWDKPRTLTGVIRSSSSGISSGSAQTLVVEAWNGSAWDTVLPLNSKTSATTLITYHAFSAPVTTNKLRLLWASTIVSSQNFTYQHGVVPVEQSAASPAPVPVPDIEWAVLIPMHGKIHPTANANAARFNKHDAPVPMYVCRVGGPGDSGEFDLILSKNTQLTSTDAPGMSGVRFNGANITE